MSTARGGAFSGAGPCTMLTLYGPPERKRHTRHLIELARRGAKATCVEWQDGSSQLHVFARTLLLQSYRTRYAMTMNAWVQNRQKEELVDELGIT